MKLKPKGANSLQVLALNVQEKRKERVAGTEAPPRRKAVIRTVASLKSEGTLPHDDVRRGTDLHDDNDSDKRPINVTVTARNGASSSDTARAVLYQPTPRPITVTARDRAGSANILDSAAVQYDSVEEKERDGPCTSATRPTKGAQDTGVQPRVRIAKAQLRVTPFSDDENEQITNSLGRQRRPITPDSEWAQKASTAPKNEVQASSVSSDDFESEIDDGAGVMKWLECPML
jgi:hypothetical protein